MEKEEILLNVADSILTDSVAASQGGEALHYGFSLQSPEALHAVYTEPAANAMSWIVVVLVAIFVIASLRYRRNAGFLISIFHDAVDVRERPSYGSTVRETSFLLLLNLLWCLCIGVLLYGLLIWIKEGSGLCQWDSDDVVGVVICSVIAAAYTLFLTIAYEVTGDVFFRGREVSLWVRGYLSTQALAGVGLFVPAIVAIAVPSSLPALLIVGGIVFALAKITFFYKGFRIFFSENTSWVLFLYYLCSLEIVPMVLAYTIAAKLTFN